MQRFEIQKKVGRHNGKCRKLNKKPVRAVQRGNNKNTATKTVKKNNDGARWYGPLTGYFVLKNGTSRMVTLCISRVQPNGQNGAQSSHRIAKLLSGFSNKHG